LAASVAAELVHPVQHPDGSLADPALFAGYLTVWTVGAAALVVAVLGLPAGRVARAVAGAGAGLLLAFGVVVVVSALTTGTPWEPSFLAFAAGLLLSAVGAVLIGVRLRAWQLYVAAAGALVALLAPSDPWHDLGLLLFCAAWATLGVALLRGARRPEAVGATADRAGNPPARL
jgi:hypothetical protein